MDPAFFRLLTRGHLQQRLRSTIPRIGPFIDHLLAIVLFFLYGEELTQGDDVAWLRCVFLTSVVVEYALIEVENEEAFDKLGKGEDLLLLLLNESRLQMVLHLPASQTHGHNSAEIGKG